MNDYREQLKAFAEKHGLELEHAGEDQAQAEPIASALKRQIEDIATGESGHAARAPYNFIPLNETVVPSEGTASFAKYDPDRNTGYIQCDITTRSDIYIRDTIDDGAFKQGITSKQVADFFSPGNQLKIPGSSLRGLVRSLVEIVSYGKFNNFDDYGLYYRGLADMSNLQAEYKQNMISEAEETGASRSKKRDTYLMQAGYIKRSGYNYFLIPAQIIDGQPFHAITRKQAKEIIGERYRFHESYPQPDGSCIVVSGDMPGQKRHEWVIHRPQDTEPIAIPEIDIDNYQRDKNRFEKANVLKNLTRGSDNLAPCFYVQWTDHQGRRRISFGNTAFFRLAYNQSIGDLVPANLRDHSQMDMAEAIFGDVNPERITAGRVYFEDAIMDQNWQHGKLKAMVPQNLASPKPTTFQHYLVQDAFDIHELNHYNSQTILRGYKNYWHKKGDWQVVTLIFDRSRFFKFLTAHKLRMPERFYRITGNGQKITIQNVQQLDDQKLRQAILEFIQQDERSQYTVIKPVPPGVTFTGRIRFENLTFVELGALLFVLQLPDDGCHKIGMGKPLGLGSIKITSTLYLSDRQQRYTELLSEWSSILRQELNVTQFTNAFQQYIIEHLEPGEAPPDNNLWDTYRLRHLKALLSWDNTEKPGWGDRTRYLNLKEFRDRRVLPGACSVARGA